MLPMKTKSELLKDARSQVPEVQPLDLSRQSPGPVIVDVREKDETDAGMLPGAKPAARGQDAEGHGVYAGPQPGRRLLGVEERRASRGDPGAPHGSATRALQPPSADPR